MANKYIIHGATFCGDGTSPALATSDGAVGAWNNIAFMEGTPQSFGTLAAGDVVYIRSKDASNANIIRTLTANRSLGSTSVNASANTTWILDDGTVFPGFNGTLTYTNASTFITTFIANNRFISSAEGAWIVTNTAVNPSAGNRLADLYGTTVNLKFDWSAKTGTGQCYAFYGYNGATVERPIIVWGPVGGAANETSRGIIVNPSIDSLLTVINPSITLNNSTPGFALFTSTARNGIRVFGGDVSGAGATTGQPLYTPGSQNGYFESLAFNFPRVMDVTAPSFIGGGSLAGQGYIRIVGCDGGLGGHLESPWGYATSRSDNNPPTLSAQVPDSSGTAWSWRVYPKTATQAVPCNLTSAKLYTSTVATKTITQEVLVANSMSPTTDKMWMTVEYVDATTGLTKHLTTRSFAAAALTSSTAPWSATVWKTTTFNKYKLSVATPTAIKQNTLITVTFFSTQASANGDEILFVDPDFGVS